MIAAILTALFAVTAIATLFALADSFLRGRQAFAALQRERALASAGFLPMVEAKEVRLRQPARINSVTAPVSTKRVPSRVRVAA